MLQLRNNCTVKYLLSIFILNILIVSSVQAAPIGQVQVNVSVQVLAPTCSINGNRVIDVNFGNDVNTARINGINYMETLTYDIDCPDASSNNMRIKIGGTGDKYLPTSKPNLSIVFYNGSNQLDLNQWSSFSYPNKPIIRAAPIKSANVALSGGTFIATATMYIEYQ